MNPYNMPNKQSNMFNAMKLVIAVENIEDFVVIFAKFAKEWIFNIFKKS